MATSQGGATKTKQNLFQAGIFFFSFFHYLKINIEIILNIMVIVLHP